MQPETILILIVIITVVSYLFDQILDYINLKSQHTNIPKEIESFYESEKYLKSLAYHKERVKFSFITSAFSFLISVLMLIMGGFGWIDGILREEISNEIVLALVFFGVLMLA